MSDKPKPFAEVVLMRGLDGEEWPYAIDANGQRLLTVGDVSDEDIDDIAKEINGAVEAREAKLRGALQAMVGWCELAYHEAENEMPEVLVDAIAVLADGGPDYVPRAQLEAAEAKLQGTWGVLFDELQSRGEVDGAVRALMEAVGISTVEHVFSDDYSYGHDGKHVTITGTSLCGKRLEVGGNWSAVTLEHFRASGPCMKTCVDCGARADAGAVKPRRSCPHCNDMPYRGPNGANYACPECGVYRPLTVTTDRTG